MNCSDCLSKLEDMLDGELEASVSNAVTDHVAACVSCNLVKIGFERENMLYSSYAVATNPEVDQQLWDGIHIRIADQPEFKTTSPHTWRARLRELLGGLLTPALARQAAFGVVLVAASVGLTYWYLNSTRTSEIALPTAALSNRPEQPTPSSAVGPVATSSETTDAAVRTKAARTGLPKPIQVARQHSDDEILSQQIRKATFEYRGAIRLLERSIARRKPNLDNDAMKQYEASLALIDSSIAASRQALNEHPYDPAAAKFLLAAYSKKVELMQEIAMR